MDGSGKREVLLRIAGAAVRPVAPLELAAASVSRDRKEIVDQFAEFAEEYRAHVVRVSESELAEAVRQRLEVRGSQRVVIPPDLAREWLGTVEAEPDVAFDNRKLSEMDAVVTGSAVAIAETGTIVLDAGAGQGRRALSLIPDHHICVVFEDQVVDSVPEAVAAVEGAVREGRPLTWISGPSATSDIELCRVEGVHGPRILDVILVARPLESQIGDNQ